MNPSFKSLRAPFSVVVNSIFVVWYQIKSEYRREKSSVLSSNSKKRKIFYLKGETPKVTDVKAYIRGVRGGGALSYGTYQFTIKENIIINEFFFLLYDCRLISEEKRRQTHIHLTNAICKSRRNCNQN